MTRPTLPPIADPLVDDVRDRRRAMFAELDDDLELLYRTIRYRQDEHPDKIVDRRDRPEGSRFSAHRHSD